MDDYNDGQWTPEGWIVVAALAGALIAAPLLYALASGGGDYPLYRFVPLVFGLLAVVALVPVETLGLLAGVRLAGGRLVAGIVGPFALQRGQDGWHARVGRRFTRWNGQFAVDQPEPEAMQRLARAAMGGLYLGSLLTLVYVALAVVFVVRAGDLDPLHTAPALLLLPLFRRPYRMLALARGQRALLEGEAARPIVAELCLASANAAGRRPRAWDLSLVTQAERAGVAGLLAASQAAQDRGEVELARTLIERALASGTDEAEPDTERAAVLLEAAYVAARQRNDPEAARGYLRVSKRLALEAHSALRVEAAVLLAEGQRERAQVAALEGLALLRPTLVPGLARVHEEQLRAILADLNVVVPTATPWEMPPDELATQRQRGLLGAGGGAVVGLLLGIVILATFSVPSISFGGDGEVAAATGTGSSQVAVDALLLPVDLPAGWLLAQPDEAPSTSSGQTPSTSSGLADGGLALRCTRAALFLPRSTESWAIGTLADATGRGPWLNELLIVTSERRAERLLQGVTGTPPCAAEEAAGTLRVDTLASPSVGDEAAAWRMTEDLPAGRERAAIVLVVRAGGTVVVLTHWDDARAPSLPETVSLAHRALEKAALVEVEE